MTTALLVVDMLNDFLFGVLANPPAEAIVEPIAALIDAARDRHDWVVIYGNDAHRAGDIELNQFGEHAMAGTHGAQVIEVLKPQDQDVIVPKRFYSAFSQTDLLATIQAHGVDQLVIAGQHTDCCVRHTSYDAFRARIPVTVTPDTTAVFGPGSPEPAEARQVRALDYLRTYYGVEVASRSTDLLDR